MLSARETREQSLSMGASPCEHAEVHSKTKDGTGTATSVEAAHPTKDVMAHLGRSWLRPNPRSLPKITSWAL